MSIDELERDWALREAAFKKADLYFRIHRIIGGLCLALGMTVKSGEHLKRMEELSAECKQINEEMKEIMKEIKNARKEN